MPFCSECGTSLGDHKTPCPTCGEATMLRPSFGLISEIEQVQPITQPSNPPQPKPVTTDSPTVSAGWTIFFLLTGGGILVAFAIVALIANKPTDRLEPFRPANAPPEQFSPTDPTPKPKRVMAPSLPQTPVPDPTQRQGQSVLNQTFRVPATGYVYFPLTLGDSATLTGDYSASGGSNDINFLILADEEFANWKAGRGYRFIEETGYGTGSAMMRKLAAGQYWLLFDNRKALLTEKRVTANFTIE